MASEHYKFKAEISTTATDDIMNEVGVKEEPIEVKPFSEYGMLNEYLEKNDSKLSPTHFYENKDFNGLAGELENPKVNNFDNGVKIKNEGHFECTEDCSANSAELKSETFKTEYDIDIINEDVKPQICEEKSSGKNENVSYLNSVTNKLVGRKLEPNFSREFSKDSKTWPRQNIAEDGAAVGSDTRKDPTITMNSRNCHIIQNNPPESKQEFIERPHTGEKPFQCKICSKSFNLKYLLTAHVRIHNGEKIFQCKNCSKSFNVKYLLTTHMRIHTGEKLFQCHLCPMSFAENRSLLRHKKIHTVEKQFQCKICSKSFNLKRYLTAHVRIHAVEKPFRCKGCPMTFAVKSSLLRHEKIHTGEKPFRCKICSKSFNLMQYLTVHMRNHTGEKPFQCKLCPKSFAENSSLWHHNKIHTVEKPF